MKEPKARRRLLPFRAILNIVCCRSSLLIGFLICTKAVGKHTVGLENKRDMLVSEQSHYYRVSTQKKIEVCIEII